MMARNGDGGGGVNGMVSGNMFVSCLFDFVYNMYNTLMVVAHMASTTTTTLPL